MREQIRSTCRSAVGSLTSVAVSRWIAARSYRTVAGSRTAVAKSAAEIARFVAEVRVRRLAGAPHGRAVRTAGFDECRRVP